MQTVQHNSDPLVIGGHTFTSRPILDSGKYPLKLIEAAARDAEAELITLVVHRANAKEHKNILDYTPQSVILLPSTPGTRNTEEAVRIARLTRGLGCSDFVKTEVIRGSKYPLPDNQETIRVAEVLAKEGLVVIPYMYPDLNMARDLVSAGAAVVMPLVSPIGSNKGLATREFIQILIDGIGLLIIVNTGTGRLSQTCGAMEMGAAIIITSTVLAITEDLPLMASVFQKAIEVGRQTYPSGLGWMLVRGTAASNPLIGSLRD